MCEFSKMAYVAFRYQRRSRLGTPGSSEALHSGRQNSHIAFLMLFDFEVERLIVRIVGKEMSLQEQQPVSYN